MLEEDLKLCHAATNTTAAKTTIAATFSAASITNTATPAILTTAVVHTCKIIVQAAAAAKTATALFKQIQQCFKKTIRQSFKEESRTSGREPLVLSAALEADIEDAKTYYQIKQVGRLVDFACLMAYDMHGYWNLTAGAQHHSPLFPEIRSSIRSWLAAGFPKDKLVVTVSASGRSFTLVSAPVGSGVGQPVQGAGRVGDRTGEEGLLDYGEICEYLDSNTWRREWLPDRSVPVAMGNSSDGWQWVGYDDPESFSRKAQFVRTENLAGVALWTLEHDDFNGECGQGDWPLLRTLWEQLNPSTRSVWQLKLEKKTT
ncbi:chitinase-3-like protein 1 [Elysia marginata]|uniref:Chitinase-3-like protein 1 n=1 Tax=Elysia marginata TaxID=1093978 RepID=A0AAV4JHB0_9GAST|nr:chitinase-3-like protein 1 [Elysia marginata]